MALHEPIFRGVYQELEAVASIVWPMLNSQPWQISILSVQENECKKFQTSEEQNKPLAYG